MSEGEEELSKEEVRENDGGLILGCWDQEKTETLILDLEHSVNLVERKCIQLFEELIYYKKYLEESGKEEFRLSDCKSKARKSKNSNFCSGSEPDIAFRKNLINFQEVQRVFEEKFKAKLCCINKELREAARKIGLKENIVLLRPGDAARAEVEDEAEKCSAQLGENFLTFFSGKTKSDPVIIERGEREEEQFSKITRDELEIYKKLSRLSMKRRKKKKKFKGRKMKFRFKRKKSLRCRRDFRTCKAESKKSKFRKNKLRERKIRTSVLRARSHSPCDSSSKRNSQGKLNESELEEICKSLNESLGVKILQGSEDATEGNRSLGAAIRKAVPFTACASTSRSHNVALNLQQLLSLSKHGKSFAPEKRTQSTEFREVKSSHKISPRNGEKEHFIPWIPDKKNCVFENFEAGRLERKRKVSTPELGKSSNNRRVRSKYTGSSPEEVLQYYKSTTRQYINGRKSMIKSESKTAYAVGSRIVVSDCRRSEVFRIGRRDDHFQNASGDSTSNEGCDKSGVEWTKAYGCFLSMCRKYSSLKEKLTDDPLAPADQELKSLESEIDYSIEKYKDFLQFYSKTREVKTLTPTHSSSLKKALREVQTLQEKIRLVNV